MTSFAPIAPARSRRPAPVSVSQELQGADPDVSPASKRPRKSKEQEGDPRWMPLRDAMRRLAGRPMKSKEKPKLDETVHEAQRASEQPAAAPEPPRAPYGIIAPKVQIVDGKLVVDQSSLVVTASVPQQMEFPVLNEGTAHITSASFMRRNKSERWSREETEKFYDALRKYGTDFSMLEKVFPNRTRRQLKNKFKREERENAGLIDEILSKSRLPLTMEQFHELEETLAAEGEKDKTQSVSPPGKSQEEQPPTVPTQPESAEVAERESKAQSKKEKEKKKEKENEKKQEKEVDENENVRDDEGGGEDDALPRKPGVDDEVGEEDDDDE